jgi:hypothetical protein
MDQFIKLRIDLLKCGAKRERKDGIVTGKHSDGGPENTSFKP